MNEFLKQFLEEDFKIIMCTFHGQDIKILDKSDKFVEVKWVLTYLKKIFEEALTTRTQHGASHNKKPRLETVNPWKLRCYGHKLWKRTTHQSYNWFKPIEVVFTNISETYADLGIGMSGVRSLIIV